MNYKSFLIAAMHSGAGSQINDESACVDLAIAESPTER
jgi:hypothetical protein